MDLRKKKAEYHRRSLDSPRFPQPSRSKTSPVRHKSLPNCADPEAFVEEQKKYANTKTNRSANHKHQSVTAPVASSNQQGRDENETDSTLHRVRQAVDWTPKSMTPTVLKGNNSVTPPSSNERTLVMESPFQIATTPNAGQRPSVNSATKRLLPNAGSMPRTRNRDPEKRRSLQGSENPKLDTYVTYGKEDLRITFV